MWDVDKIPTGPGLVKRHGVLDVNWTDPKLTGAGGSGGPALPKGGTAGQVLTKDSATNYEASWQTPSGGGSGNLDGGTPSTVYTPITNVNGGAP